MGTTRIGKGIGGRAGMVAAVGGVLFLSSCDDDVDETDGVPANEAPVALINGPDRLGEAPFTNYLNAGFSTDADGEIVSYLWDYGDGRTSTQVARNHTWAEPGVYTVTLTVTDDQGAVATASRLVTVTPSAAVPMVMPVEVLSAGTHVEARTFDLPANASADTLSITCHRCGYRDTADGTPDVPKASVRLNDGPWVDLTDEAAEVSYPESLYGGIQGGYNTVRMTVPVAGAQEGANTIQFRFNGTDGFTTGYRVLAFDLHDGEGPGIIPKAAFVQDDPDDWTPPLAAQADIAAGDALWSKRGHLRDSPFDTRIIKASCADCHTTDAEDLKYFNYSNRSIVERSRFHGLTEREGEQLASYVRTRTSPAPAIARPWNPPYQPGPGLDAKPATHWAAGAGLAWVLDDDAEMLPWLFPKEGTEVGTVADTSPANIARIASTRGTMNVREMPMAMQLPDWNDWLVEEHPREDFMWGDDFDNWWPMQTYVAAHDALGGGEADFMRSTPSRVANRELLGVIDDQVRTHVQFFAMSGAQPCRNQGVHGSKGFELLGINGPAPADGAWNSGDPDFCERWLRSVKHWSAVKQWEVNQRYGLDGAAPDVYPYGEARSWLGEHRGVFDLAPHRIGNDSIGFVHASNLDDRYLNAAWYQLQVILNAGNRNPQDHRPPDWKYQMNHTFLAVKDTGHDQSMRYLQSLIKMGQNLDMRKPEGADEPADHYPFLLDRGPNDEGWWLNHVNPWRFHAIGGGFFQVREGQREIVNHLDEIEPGLKNKVQNVMLEQWLDKTETYHPDEFPRGDTQEHVDPADHVVTPYTTQYRVADGTMIADGIYRVIPMLREDGVDEALIERLRLWGREMWPGDPNNPGAEWDKVAAPDAPVPTRFLRPDYAFWGSDGQTGDATAIIDNQTSTRVERTSQDVALTVKVSDEPSRFDRIEIEPHEGRAYRFRVETGDGRLLADWTGNASGGTVLRVPTDAEQLATTIRIVFTGCGGASCNGTIGINEVRVFGRPGG